MIGLWMIEELVARNRGPRSKDGAQLSGFLILCTVDFSPMGWLEAYVSVRRYVHGKPHH